MTLPPEAAPRAVKDRLDAGEKIFLIDVREPHEFQAAAIAGAEMIPMREVPAAIQRLETLADQGTLVVYCHHGIRSMNVVHWLREHGLEACQSLAGGIDRWSLEVDASVPRYS